MNEDLQSSPRFETPPERRDFLGMAALGSAAAALAVAGIGAARLPMPSVFPEANTRVKLGPLSQYIGVPVTAIPEHRLWIHWETDGLYAISGVCTHLGCIVQREGEAGFFCPCHGSRFDGAGRPIAGPAPGPLHYLLLQVSADGQLVVDKQQQSAADVRLQVSL